VSLEFEWPEIFTTQQVKYQNHASLCADAIMAWGLTHVTKAPETFGDVMVKIGHELGISPTPDNLTKFAKQKGWLK
jgi:hypothetical protein